MSIKTVFYMPVELYDRVSEEAEKLGKTRAGLYRKILAEAWGIPNGTGMQMTRISKTTVGQIMECLSYSEDTAFSELQEHLSVCDRTIRNYLRQMEADGYIKLHYRGQGNKLWIERTDV